MSFSKITAFVSLLFLFSSPVFSQKITVNVYIANKINKPESDTIYYDFNRKLTWQDFREKCRPHPMAVDGGWVAQ